MPTSPEERPQKAENCPENGDSGTPKVLQSRADRHKKDGFESRPFCVYFGERALGGGFIALQSPIMALKDPFIAPSAGLYASMLA